MKILVDIVHPAHVHLFCNFLKEMRLRGHKTIVTIRNSEIVKQLLQKKNIPYITLGRKSDLISGKFIKQLYFNYRIFLIVKKNKIDVGIGSSVSISHISRLTKMKSILFDDDDDVVEPYIVKYVHPMTDTIVSPISLLNKRKYESIYYSGFHELAYLHPNHFKPDITILNEAGLKEDETFFIMRFNVFKAHHDVGISGLSIQQKLKLIDLLKPHGKIFITAERDIKPDLREYMLPVSPDKIHTLLYFATIFLGDSQTMTSEAAVLGTPAIRCNDFVGRISYLEEEEHKYGLTYGFKPENFDKMVEKITGLLSIPHLKEEWQKRRQKMLADKIDVTAFMVWFVENYPDSATKMKENPDYQYNFK